MRPVVRFGGVDQQASRHVHEATPSSLKERCLARAIGAVHIRPLLKQFHDLLQAAFSHSHCQGRVLGRLSGHPRSSFPRRCLLRLRHRPPSRLLRLLFLSFLACRHQPLAPLLVPALLLSNAPGILLTPLRCLRYLPLLSWDADVTLFQGDVLAPRPSFRLAPCCQCLPEAAAGGAAGSRRLFLRLGLSLAAASVATSPSRLGFGRLEGALRLRGLPQSAT
mmetsp:Transcript_116952/g.261509  ORF Transcript_116952/g.261509 Transcript_116952/m.261509 type:complete len:221 (+) Transcript_116952:267-929(+)